MRTQSLGVANLESCAVASAPPYYRRATAQVGKVPSFAVEQLALPPALLLLLSPAYLLPASPSWQATEVVKLTRRALPNALYIAS